MRVLKDYFKFLSARIFTPTRNLKTWEAKNFGWQKVQLPNTKLTKDLENLCQQRGGSLTFGEFIAQEMFGENGYYKTHSDFGKTNVSKVWPEAIIKLCQKYSLNSVVEVGTGDGALGKESLKLANKMNLVLKWAGIEINQSLWNKIGKNQPKNFFLLESVRQLKPQKSLTIFPFSLDSMPNEVVVNTTSRKNLADAMLGIKIENGILAEIVLSANDLKRRGIIFQNGIFTTGYYSFDFSSWALQSKQRAYLPINGFLAIIDYVKKMSNASELLIIDEVKPLPPLNGAYHLGTPRILNSILRDFETLEQAYKNTGNNLWYFPFYLNPMLGFLKEVGFTRLSFDIDSKMVKIITDKTWKATPGIYFCYGISAKYQKQSLPTTFRIKTI